MKTNETGINWSIFLVLLDCTAAVNKNNHGYRRPFNSLHLWVIALSAFLLPFSAPCRNTVSQPCIHCSKSILSLPCFYHFYDKWRLYSCRFFLFKEKFPVVLSTPAQVLRVKYGIDLEVKGPRCLSLRSELPGKLTHGNDSSHASLEHWTRLLLSSRPLWPRFKTTSPLQASSNDCIDSATA